jgi:hypothetical protein
MDVAVLLLFTLLIALITFRYDVLRDVAASCVTFRYDALMNVAASCGVGALHGCPRGRALAGSGPAAAVAGAAPACSPESFSGSGEQDGHTLGWTGLVVLTVSVAFPLGTAAVEAASDPRPSPR